MNQTVRGPVWLYCLIMGGMMTLGGYFGYEMTNKEWIKKLNKYASDHPGQTMEDFAKECSEEE